MCMHNCIVHNWGIIDQLFLCMLYSSDSSYVVTYGCTLCSELLLTPKLFTIMEPPKIDTLKRTLARKPHSHLYSKMHLGQDFMPFLMSNFCAHSHPYCGLAIIKAMAPARRGVCARVRSAHKVRSMRARGEGQGRRDSTVTRVSRGRCK